MNHRKLTAAVATAVAALAFAGTAGAQSCAEKATRLKTEIDALPSSDSNRAGFSESLGIAMGADTVRCEEILARVEKELAASGEGHASAEKPIPNRPDTPAEPAVGPGMSDTAMGADEEGHASENDPVPNQPSGDAPAATGPSAVDSTSGSMVEEGATGHASGDDPIPNPSANSDDDAEATPED